MPETGLPDSISGRHNQPCAIPKGRVTVREIPHHSLWVGNAGDLQNPATVLSSGIEAVVELADSEPFAELPRGLIRCRFPLSDGGGNPDWLLRLSIDVTADLIRHSRPTLVCCAAGMSRSVCIAAAGLAIAEQIDLRQAFDTVITDGPADVAPVLFGEVQRVLSTD